MRKLLCVGEGHLDSQFVNIGEDIIAHMQGSALDRGWRSTKNSLQIDRLLIFLLNATSCFSGKLEIYCQEEVQVLQTNDRGEIFFNNKNQNNIITIPFVSIWV